MFKFVDKMVDEYCEKKFNEVKEEADKKVIEYKEKVKNLFKMINDTISQFEKESKSSLIEREKEIKQIIAQSDQKINVNREKAEASLNEFIESQSEALKSQINLEFLNNVAKEVITKQFLKLKPFQIPDKKSVPSGYILIKMATITYKLEHMTWNKNCSTKIADSKKMAERLVINEALDAGTLIGAEIMKVTEVSSFNFSCNESKEGVEVVSCATANVEYYAKQVDSFNKEGVEIGLVDSSSMELIDN